jgi:hypothetical protein
VTNKRKLFRNLAIVKNILIDVYSVGILILFMVCGSYEWATTRDINSIFDAKIV